MLCYRKGLPSGLKLYPSSNQFHCFSRPSNQSTQNRTIGSIAKIEELGKSDEVEDDLLSSFTKRRGGRTKKGVQKISPRDWLLSEEGLQFRNPTIGRTNWIGDDIPFPTNPWFKPKPPLSDQTRTKVYESFKQRVNLFSQKNSLQNLSADEKKRHEEILIRETSEQWGIALEKISAIIRLKAMEDSWLTDQNDQIKIDHRRTLQLNFEKGMENVLGVKSDRGTRLNEDINQLVDRRLKRRAKFYGTQFVPLDSPPLENHSAPENSPASKTQRLKNKQKYQEPIEPTETRHIIGTDGLPRPSTSYISNPPGKVPMVFTDVSKFPRAPKPMSKAKTKYYPKTSLLPNYQAILTTRSTQRSISTTPSSSTNFNQSIINDERFSENSCRDDVLDSTTNASMTDQRNDIEEEKKNLAFRLLRQLKGCSNSENGLKVLNQLGKSVEGSKFIELTGIDPDEIKEKLLLQAGGLSFKTHGPKSSMIKNDYPSNQVNQIQADLSEDEKHIRSIKLDMIKSIYLKKLELNSSGRLLLPKSIRSKEEKDLKMLSSATSASATTKSNEIDLKKSTICGLDSKKNHIGNRSNRMIRKCMQGPLGRLKQRQNLVSSNS